MIWTRLNPVAVFGGDFVDAQFANALSAFPYVNIFATTQLTITLSLDIPDDLIQGISGANTDLYLITPMNQVSRAVGVRVFAVSTSECARSLFQPFQPEFRVIPISKALTNGTFQDTDNFVFTGEVDVHTAVAATTTVPANVETRVKISTKPIYPMFALR